MLTSVLPVAASALAFASSRVVAYRSRRRCLWVAASLVSIVCMASGARAETPTMMVSFGSGVAIGAHEILTNAHVVKDCSSKIVVRSSSTFSGHVVALDEANDLAVVHSDKSLSAAASFRDGPVREGDPVVVLGYPLPLALASTVNLTVGNVSALAGLHDDSRYLQFSAPVQPGNSGGPMLDASGHLVGIVTSKLPWEVVKVTGDLPQNVNFALKTGVVRTFLDSKGIGYQTAQSEKNLSPADVGQIGKPFTVQLACSGPDVEAETNPPAQAGPPVEARPHVEARPRVAERPYVEPRAHFDPPPPPPVQVVSVLPACDSPRATRGLMRIGGNLGVQVFGVYGRTLSSTSYMNVCRALVSSSAGNRIVNYNITWVDRAANLSRIHVTWYSGPLGVAAPRLPRFPLPRWRR